MLAMKETLQHLRGPWLLRCVAGLGSTMGKELVARRVIPRKAPLHWLRQRDHDLLFLSKGVHRQPGPFLRIPEMGLRCLVYGRYKISKSQLDTLASELAGATPVQLAVNVAGSHFDRRDLRRWLGQRLGERGVAASADAPRTLWVFCIDAAYYVGVESFCAADSPQRELRTEERRGSLPPSIAAAMVFLADPNQGEKVLDPACGSGTILAEAAAQSPGSTLCGFDLDRKALETAAANLSHRRSQALLAQADCGRLPLASGGTTLIVSNLPFGKQFGNKADNPRLYRGLIDEIERVGKLGVWRAVLLTSDVEALGDALAGSSRRRSKRLLRVKVRGEWAEAWRIEGVSA